MSKVNCVIEAIIQTPKVDFIQRTIKSSLKYILDDTSLAVWTWLQSKQAKLQSYHHLYYFTLKREITKNIPKSVMYILYSTALAVYLENIIICRIELEETR